MTVNTLSNMDVFVPNVSYKHCTASPLMYDHDRANYTYYGNGMVFNTSIDSVLSDEVECLDDKMENACLEAFLTPDVVSSFHQVSIPDPWAGKLQQDVSMATVSECCSSPNPSVAQLETETDVSFVVDDVLGGEQDDSKLNYSNLDCFGNEMIDFNIDPGFSGIRNSSSSSLLNLIPFSTDSTKCSETLSSQNEAPIETKPFSYTISNNFFRPALSHDHLFQPRTSQPPVVGIAAVIKPDVIKPEVKESYTAPQESDKDLIKLKNQSPILLKHLNDTQPLAEVKQEVCSSVKTLLKNPDQFSYHKDCSAQIFPSSGVAQTKLDDFVKTEPLSPKPVVMEETTEEKWKDIEDFLRSPGEQTQRKRKRFDSGSSEYIISEEEDDASSVCGSKSFYADSDDDYSDIDDDLTHISPGDCESLVTLGKKQKQYFWQYNVQSKGPKGTRLKLLVESPADPHVLNDFEDPVFDECNTAIAGIRHGGKARKGDGNEITPNPRKLFMIGHQLLRLNQQINACQLGSEVSAAKRNESRREKNKLASRACRLKKKAQHEANKIKLYGLEQEHSQLNSVLRGMWPHIKTRTKALLDSAGKKCSPTETLTSKLESQIRDNLTTLIAGHTTDFVNKVIIQVESGDNSGGLNITKNKS